MDGWMDEWMDGWKEWMMVYAWSEIEMRRRAIEGGSGGSGFGKDAGMS